MTKQPSGKRQQFITSLLYGLRVAAGMTLFPTPARAAGAAEPGVLDHLMVDAGNGLDLIDRQLAQPVTSGWGIPVLVASLVAALLIAMPLRLWLVRHISGFLARRYGGSDFASFTNALSVIIVSCILFVVAGQLAVQGIGAATRLLPQVDSLLGILFVAFVICGIGLGLGRALRAPEDKQLRPARLAPGMGSMLGTYPVAAAAMLGLAAFVGTAAKVLNASETTWAITQGVLVVAEALLVARFLVAAGQARARRVEAEGPDDADVPAIFGVTAIAWAALLAGCGALLFGWLQLAMQIMQGMLWIGLVLSIAWITARFVDVLIERLLAEEHRAARFATGIVGVGQSRIGQASLLLSAIANVLIWTIALLLILAPLNGSGPNVVDQVRPGPFLRSLKALHLSPRVIFTAVAVLVGGIAATRVIRSWFERRFLPATNLDVGAKTSIVTGLSYLGIIIALLAASSTLGLQLEKITLIASALSVGIGFGLQAIIQNFVSGVILLIERPVRQDDWVTVSGTEGKIRKMRVRATELISDDGSIAIVPNSAFISSTVVNRGDGLGRSKFDVSVKVTGAMKPMEAKQALQAFLGSLQSVRQSPKPKIRLRAQTHS